MSVKTTVCVLLLAALTLSAVFGCTAKKEAVLKYTFDDREAIFYAEAPENSTLWQYSFDVEGIFTESEKTDMGVTNGMAKVGYTFTPVSAGTVTVTFFIEGDEARTERFTFTVDEELNTAFVGLETGAAG